MGHAENQHCISMHECYSCVVPLSQTSDEEAIAAAGGSASNISIPLQSERVTGGGGGHTIRRPGQTSEEGWQCVIMEEGLFLGLLFAAAQLRIGSFLHACNHCSKPENTFV